MWNTGRVIGRNGRVGGLIHHGPVSAAPRFSHRRSLSIDDAMSQQDDQRADRDPDNPGLRRVKPDDRIGGPSSHNAPITADRATILAHELNNLLDGSIRCLGIAQHSLAVQLAATEAESLETARRQMEAVRTALERMCELVHASMMGESVRTHSLLQGQKAQRVNDAVDQCPNTPATNEVDLARCSINVPPADIDPTTDTDGDGVLDGADLCPATGAGTQVDSDGCPLDDGTGSETDPTNSCGADLCGAGGSVSMMMLMGGLGLLRRRFRRPRRRR